MNLCKPWCILKLTVDFIFVTKLRATGTMLFELDSNLSFRKMQDKAELLES
jgi:hypothetical protein